MTREEAAYQMILLKSNITDEYDAWLDHYLEIEDPLSDILLKLLDCRSHLSVTISCLQFYCWEKEYDHQSVAEKLRLYLKNAYLSGKIDRETCVNDMYAFAYKSERMHEEFAVMSTISDYYELAEDQILDIEKWEKLLFLPYLLEGKFEKSNIWARLAYPKKGFLWRRIKQKFKNKK